MKPETRFFLRQKAYDLFDIVFGYLFLIGITLLCMVEFLILQTKRHINRWARQENLR